MADTHAQIVWLSAIPLGLSLMAAAIALVGTSRYGVGLSSDSAEYLFAAKSLLAGDGYVAQNGRPWTAWPPLFPTLLAALSLAGVNLSTAARFLNALAFGGIVFAASRLFSRYMNSTALVIVATFSTVLSVPLLRVSTMAWTEPVFILLILLFFLSVPAFLRQRRFSRLAVLSVLTALCMLQRYLGVVLLCVGAVLIIFALRDVSVRHRLRYLLCFLVISCTPLVLWVARNYALTSAFTGRRCPSRYSLWEGSALAFDIVTTWCMPDAVPLAVRRAILTLALGAMATVLLLGRRRLAAQEKEATASLWPLGLFVLIYTPLLLLTHQVGVDIEPINERYLAPLFVFVVLLAFVAVERITVWPGSRGARFLVVGLCTLWMIYPLARVRATMSDWMRHGAGGYSSALWRESPLIDWLRSHPLAGRVYSNAPEALYVLADIDAEISPRTSVDMAMFEEFVASSPNQYLVWCENMPRPNLHGMEALISTLWMERIATFSDGVVCRFVPATDRVLPHSRILSPCLINGVWSRTFTSDSLGLAGVITSWVLDRDGTTKSVWEWHATDGTVIRWCPSCRYTLSDAELEFRARGEATESKNGTTSSYTLTVRGEAAGDMAAGTYAIQFANPQWRADDRGTWRVDRAHPVYRFWAPATGRHFYTINQQEMTRLVSRHWRTWTPERAVFCAYPEGRQPPGTSPVHYFWARDRDTHFFTMNEQEKEELVRLASDTWRYEGVAFYAYRPEHRPPHAVPVHHLRLEGENSHFYTTSESERDKLINAVPRSWIDEGVAWYALPNSHAW